MKHYKELKFEKDNLQELRKVLIDISQLDAKGWVHVDRFRDQFALKYEIPVTDVISFASPFYKYQPPQTEHIIFSGVVFIGIQENSIIVLDIIDQFKEHKLPVHLYNYVLRQFIQDIVNPNNKIFKDYIGIIKSKREKPAAHKIQIEKKQKKSLVISASPDKYNVFNYRVKKPVHFFDPTGKGEMLLQEADELYIDKKNKIDYFTLNNIALLLSVSSKATGEAKALLKKIKEKNKLTDPIKTLILSTGLICDYIEKVQTSIVFTYTTIEAFVNLSIPENYEYVKLVKEAGVSYEKKYYRDSVERLIPLKEKLTVVLPDIYDTNPIETEKFFARFTNLEELRNKIIHQKSIEHTELYNDYFKASIFDLCKVSEDIIEFFYENCKNDFSTNPLWPWIKGKEKILPKAKFKPEYFEKSGSIYD